jgi:hypothetical protein
VEALTFMGSKEGRMPSQEGVRFFRSVRATSSFDVSHLPAAKRVAGMNAPSQTVLSTSDRERNIPR